MDKHAIIALLRCAAQEGRWAAVFRWKKYLFIEKATQVLVDYDEVLKE